MMFLLLVLLQVGLPSTTVRGCLVPLSSKLRCEVIKNHGLTLKLPRTGILACMDLCVDDGRGCAVMKWNHKRRTCYIFRALHDLVIGGQCIGFQRNCSRDFDFLEMQLLTNMPARKVLMKYTIGSSKECRILCSLLSTCWGVTWKSQGGSCMLHSEHMLDMTKARCISLKAHALSLAGVPVKAKSPPECVNYLTSRDNIKAVDWFETARHCETFNNHTNFRHMDPHLSYSHFIKLDNCVTTIKVCSLNADDTAMLGGYNIGNMPRDDCFSLCKLVRTCVAATSYSDGNDRRRCYFHGILRTLERLPGTATLQIVQCQGFRARQPADAYSKKLSDTLKHTQGYRQSNSSMFKQYSRYTSNSWLLSLYKLM